MLLLVVEFLVALLLVSLVHLLVKLTEHGGARLLLAENTLDDQSSTQARVLQLRLVDTSNLVGDSLLLKFQYFNIMPSFVAAMNRLDL